MTHDKLRSAVALYDEIRDLKKAKEELAARLTTHDPSTLKISMLLKDPQEYTLHTFRHPPLEMSTPDFVDLYSAKLNRLIAEKEKEFSDLQ